MLGLVGVPLAEEAQDDAGQHGREIMRHLAALPTRLREAVILRYLEERNLQEAAAMAGCPEGALGWRAMEAATTA